MGTCASGSYDRFSQDEVPPALLQAPLLEAFDTALCKQFASGTQTSEVARSTVVRLDGAAEQHPAALYSYSTPSSTLHTSL